MKTLVLGTGNEIMGDDGIGLYVVRKLGGDIKGIDWRITSEGGLKIIDYLLGYDRIIIVDAMVSGGQPGDIQVFSLRDFKTPGFVPNHSFDLISALRAVEKFITAQIPGFPSEIYFIAITISETGKVSSEFSEQIQSKLSKIVDTVRREIMKIIKAHYKYSKATGGEIHGKAKGQDGNGLRYGRSFRGTRGLNNNHRS